MESVAALFVVLSLALVAVGGFTGVCGLAEAIQTEPAATYWTVAVVCFGLAFCFFLLGQLIHIRILLMKRGREK